MKNEESPSFTGVLKKNYLMAKMSQVDKGGSIARMSKILNDMENDNFSEELLVQLPELSAKLIENQKLKYRLNIMKRSASEKSECSNGLSMTKKQKSEKRHIKVIDFGDSMIERLTDLFRKSVDKLFPDLDGITNCCSVRETTNYKFGDYQFDQSPAISQKLLSCGIKKSPNEVGRSIATDISAINESYIGEVKVVGPFVNIFVAKQFVSRRMADIFLNGISIPQVEKCHVIVDFSSPNVAKQMHVGHLRSTIIGDSICRLLEIIGFSVLRLNHIGDWGTQFGMLIAFLKDKHPDFLTQPPQIEDLQRFYKESKVCFDNDKEFEIRAKQCVVQLQKREPDILKAWNIICEKSRQDFAQIYKRLDVRLLERGESFYQDRMLQLIKEMNDNGILIEEEGRKLYFPKQGSILPLTLVKSDGGFTYDTSDLTALKQRLVEEKADWVLYVVDRGQSEHLESVFAAAQEFGLYDPSEKRVEHIQFGLVLGEDKKKFKSRSGDTVKLTDLLDEGIVRAENKLIEKSRQDFLTPDEFSAAKEAVAYGCIKYADLSTGRSSDYLFSFDRMLDDRGNTAVYLLYAYARIRSIIRTANTPSSEVFEYVKLLGESPLPLTHERELKLAKRILMFADILLIIIESLQLHKLCEYVYDLAVSFHDFYNSCYVVSKNSGTNGDAETETIQTQVHMHRLVLCEVTANVMKQCFDILGIRSLEKM